MPTQFDNQVEKLASHAGARQITDSNSLRSSYILPLPAHSLMTFRLFGSQREVEFDDHTNPNAVNALQTDRHEQSHGGELQMNLPLGFTVGGNFIHDREDHTDLLTPINSFDRWVENYGIFAQEEFHFKSLTLIPSGRYDHNSQAGDFENPRVQAIAEAADWLRFSGSAGRSFRAPTIDDLYLTSGGIYPFTGNPNLRTEKAWTYDAGFELHADSISFRATYFRANVTDLIQIQPITFNTAVNVGEAHRQGAEIQLNHIVNKYFKDAWNYTYLENLGIPPGFDHRVVLAFSPRHTVNYKATVTPAKRWTIDSIVRYEDKRFEGNDQTGTKLGSQVVWDMRLAYQWRQMECLGVDDIVNRRYEEQPVSRCPGEPSISA